MIYDVSSSMCEGIWLDPKAKKRTDKVEFESSMKEVKRVKIVVNI